ncbi:hypothetical protein MBM09_00310 [Flaviramulus sp. BrNp1-15]|uniref:hypothetical protein n=1 Tax=Flaviramulus sp. BrNp1-15 TaxID=2916754 RepID=UPI001EE95E06|nr:hypothetical protein [Flaviramulus sp. BrNp1-15]ULC59438.1 hypothetical protein MBM09_00310 [Flaviramulus sp. BrNp1-15]
MKYPTFLKILVFITIPVCMYSCKEENSKTPPKQIITIDEAVNMFKTEMNVKSKVVNPLLQKIYKDSTFEDTQFAWFSLEEMKAYINYIEAVQMENPDQKVSGIRVYFGRYNETSKKFANQQSVFLVPTVANSGINSKYENLNHLPFGIIPDNPENPIKGTYTVLNQLVLNTDDKNSRIKNFQKNSNNKQEANFSFFLKNSNALKTTSLILNEGELAPPPKKED